jgi:hypothetical protein
MLTLCAVPVPPRWLVRCLCVLVTLLGAAMYLLWMRYTDSEAALKAALDPRTSQEAAAAAEAAAALAATSLTFKLSSSSAIPFNKFARQCRCFTRAATTVPTHVTKFEAIVDHIYSQV